MDPRRDRSYGYNPPAIAPNMIPLWVAPLQARHSAQASHSQDFRSSLSTAGNGEQGAWVYTGTLLPVSTNGSQIAPYDYNMSSSTSVFARNSIMHATEQARNPPHLQNMRADAPFNPNNMSTGQSMAPPPQATSWRLASSESISSRSTYDNSRKAFDLTQTTDVPPPLAPTVEEAYRRKCIQLKQRLNEIEADNEATRVRVQRIERSIQKQRIERAFLLEQLAKRTSTNVEDSEGSPSPPPTVSIPLTSDIHLLSDESFHSPRRNLSERNVATESHPS